MHTLFDLMSAFVAGAVSLVLMAAVLNPRVHDGVVVKTGLVSMSLGFGSVALRTLDGTYDWAGIGMGRSVSLISVGAAIVIAGYWHRTRAAGHPMRRAGPDWIDRRCCAARPENSTDQTDAKP